MKKLLILSGKGGTGKTTVAAAFIDLAGARAFADCDVDAPNLHLVTDIESKPKRWDFYGSQKAVVDPSKCTGCNTCLAMCRFDAIVSVRGRCEINEFACEGCGVCSYVCPEHAVSLCDDVAGEQMLYCGPRTFSTAKLNRGRGNSGKLVTEVKKALFESAPDTELAVIDGSPGVGCPVIASVSGVDLVLVVAEPSYSGIHDMRRILKTAAAMDAKTAVCVNKFDVSPENTEAIERDCRENGIPFVGKIPYDKQASAAINAGRSLATVDCPAKAAIEDVVKNTAAILAVTEP